MLIPFGYAKPGAATELEILMDHPQSYIVDVRFNPRASAYHREWNGTVLASRFPGRYVHIQALGNTNYKTHGHIKLKSQEAGLERLRKGLGLGFNLIVLCACKDYGRCHRRVICELMQQEGASVFMEAPSEKKKRQLNGESPNF